MSRIQIDDEERAVDALVVVIDQFFDEVDPDTFESEDLAYTVLRALKQLQSQEGA